MYHINILHELEEIRIDDDKSISEMDDLVKNLITKHATRECHLQAVEKADNLERQLNYTVRDYTTKQIIA